MRNPYILLIALHAATLGNAFAWYVNGTVQSNKGGAIAGVQVSVVDSANLSTTTNVQGAFELPQQGTTILPNPSQIQKIITHHIDGNQLTILSPQNGLVQISLIDPSGKNQWSKRLLVENGMARTRLPDHILHKPTILTIQDPTGKAQSLRREAVAATPALPRLRFQRIGFQDTTYPMLSDSVRNVLITMRDTTSPTSRVNGVAFEMVAVQGGTYQRGCDTCAAQDQQYEAPVHSVTLSDFSIGKYEVTQAQWRAVMGGSAPAFGASESSPKIGVTWFEANAFACKLDSLTGKAFRLLTDAEWEFAARGGNIGKANHFRYSGSNNADDVAWHTGNSGNQSHEVGTKAANELGVYDMSGNAWEWVYDWLVAYTSSATTNPVQLTGSGNKTRRGGSYDEPVDFSRVSRRAIRSRDGAAGMGFRIAHSQSLPAGMVSPCEAANPTASTCSGDKNRDCRLITQDGEVWATTDGSILIAKSNGAAVVSGYPTTSGEWYTLNNRSLNVVSTTGAKTTKTYAYYVFSANEMTMINDEGMPYRLYKKPVVDVTGTIPTPPTIASPTALSQLLASVEPARLVSDSKLANPDTSVRDPRLVPATGYTWFMDGRCCGGNHKYRFHLEANGNAEFVVMDYDNTLKENVLAKGRWFTVGNIGLHMIFNGKYFNYLYTAGNRSTSFSEYMPAGPIFSHISFQSYERGDFRIFSKYLYDESVKRPKGFNGENPVYEPGPYQAESGGN